MSLRHLASLAAATLGISLLLPVQGASAADPEPVDGTTAYTAAGSCWEIKQTYPDAGSGRYWLQTPAMPAPLQIYCDQSTDGGGWELVARGRDQWTEAGGGSFGAGDWMTTLPVDGSNGVMAAKQLPGATIDGLLNKGRVDALADGVRLRRALNTQGTSWQESRIKFAKRDRWSWAFSARHPVSRYTVAGLSASNVSTDDLYIGSRDDETSIMTLESSVNRFTRGFSYGANGPQGSTAGDSYLYNPNSNGVYTTPFTQMYVRPKLFRSQMSFGSIPNSGKAAITNRPIVDSRGLPTTWGVTGLGAGGQDLEYATEVSAFHQIGDVMYVGGNFTTVRNNDTGQEVDQPYLAAFNASTGAWISSFRPRLNNQVKALSSYDGRLIVGGQFTSVNGSTRRALVTVDPSTGATYEPFKADFAQTGTGRLWVRALDITGGKLYVGGGFSKVSGGSSTTLQSKNNLIRMSPATGAVDSTYAPNLGVGVRLSSKSRAAENSVMSLDASDDGATVYAAGLFTRAYIGAEGRSTKVAQGVAAVATDSRGTLRSWTAKYSTSKAARQYQQAVKQVGSRIWLGGSQHSLASYSASSRKFLGGNVGFNGGDFQAIDSGSGVVYGSCHCEQWIYHDTMGFDGRKLTGFTQADRIGFVGAWDASTGDYLPEFAPSSNTRSGEGPWALKMATDGTLWSGGDYTRTVTTDNTRDWVGGFIRFPRKDSTAPPAPSNLQIVKNSASSDYAYLRWTGSSESGVSYELLKENRVVQVIPASTGKTNSATENYGLRTNDARFFVRAVDAAGNRSATTPVLEVPAGTSSAEVAPQAAQRTAPESTTETTPAPETSEPTAATAEARPASFTVDPAEPESAQQPEAPSRELVGPESTWQLSTEPQQESSWATGSDIPDGWRTVRAPVTRGDDRNETFYARSNFTVDDPDRTVTIRTVADDGAAIYVNGVEVGRKNLPDGALSSGVTATARPSGDDELSWTIEVPAELLRAGQNVVAAEVHPADADTRGLRFDLRMTAD